MESEEKKRIVRTRYDAEFKLDAVRYLIKSGKTIKAAAEDLGVERSNLGRWKRDQLAEMDNQVRITQQGVKPSEMEAEVRRLRAELLDMREQRDILKKALSVFAQKPPRGISS